MLTLEGVHSFYGPSHVIQGVSLRVERGETVALVGRNGAGKTTLLKTIMGIVRARQGRIALDGEDILQSLVFAVQNLLDGIAWAKTEGLHPLNVVLNAGYALSQPSVTPEDKDIAALIAPNVEQTIAVLRQLNEWAKATYNAY